MVVSMQADSPDDLTEPRLAQLYRETPRPEPSADLDRAILATARREVRARPMFARSALRRWHVPASIAAVVVLSVTVVTLVREHGGGESAETPPAPPRERTSAAPQALRDRVETAPVTVDPQAPPAPSLPATGQEQAPQTAAAPGHGATISSDSGPKAAPEARRLAGVEARGRAETQAPIAGNVDIQPGAQEAAAPRPAARADVLPAGPEAKASESHADVAPTGRIEEKAATPQPRAAPAQGAGAIHPPPAVSATREQRAPSAQVEPARKRVAVPSVPAQLAKALEGQPPERWLEKIDELRRTDRAVEADELLAAFRKRFPDHPGAAKP